MKFFALFALAFFCFSLCVFGQEQSESKSVMDAAGQKILGSALDENGAVTEEDAADESAAEKSAQEKPKAESRPQTAEKAQAQESADAADKENAAASEDAEQVPAGQASEIVVDGKDWEKPKIELAGVSEVPPAKRPKKPDAEKAAAAAKKDEKDSEQKARDTIKYGIEPELVELVKKLIENDDPRYSDELYDLFQETKSPVVREKILEYFTKFEDPCLEDYAVTVLNDPYETRASTVEQAFKYISALKTKAAIPAVVTLLESENESYFSPALTTLGELGGDDEAEYLVQFLDRSDLTTAQRQALMKVLGKIKATQTFDALVEIANDDGENIFVRSYAAEAIGAMKRGDSVEVLNKLFEEQDPTLRCYVIKGLAYNEDDKDARQTVVQAIKDSQYKVRLDAIDAAAKMKIKESVPYIIHRAKGDPEAAVKKKAYEKLAAFGDGEADKFLVGQITDKKASDNVKRQTAEALLKYGKAGKKEIGEWAESLAADNTKRAFRKEVAKLLTKYPDGAFAGACAAFIASSDKDTRSAGLDMYSAGKYSSCESAVRAIANDKKADNSVRQKAMKILGIEDEPKKPEIKPAASNER